MFASDDLANRRLQSGVNYGSENCYGQRCWSVSWECAECRSGRSSLLHGTVGSSALILVMSNGRTVRMMYREGGVASCAWRN